MRRAAARSWERGRALGEGLLRDPRNPRADRLAAIVLALAAVAYFALGLYLARGVSFVMDELVYFGDTRGYSLEAFFEPFGGHLTAGLRTTFLLGLDLFGSSHLPFQVITLLSGIAVSVLLFLLVRREVGPLPALAAAVVILFLGSTQTVLWGSSVMWTQSTAAGLLALLLLQRNDRRGDVLACVALTASVLSLEVGVAFSVGVAVWMVVERGGLSRRLWVVLVPIGVYVAWFAWARIQFDNSPVGDLENILLFPSAALDSAAASTAALLGLVIDLAGGDPALIPLGWGRVALVGLVALLVIGLIGRRPPALWWGVAAFLIVFWISVSMAYGPFRNPASTRYVYPVAVGLILLLATAYRGRAIRPGAVGAILVIAVFSLMVNLHSLRERGRDLRLQSERSQATMGVYELEREVVDPDFHLGVGLAVTAGDYLAAADRYGAIGWSAAELSSQPESAKQAADEAIGAIALPRLELRDDARCAPGTSAEGPVVAVPAGGALVRLPEAAGNLSLRRFAEAFTIEAGPLPAKTFAYLELPADGPDPPWYGSAGGTPIEVCSPGQPGAG